MAHYYQKQEEMKVGTGVVFHCLQGCSSTAYRGALPVLTGMVFQCLQGWSSTAYRGGLPVSTGVVVCQNALKGLELVAAGIMCQTVSTVARVKVLDSTG